MTCVKFVMIVSLSLGFPVLNAANAADGINLLITTQQQKAEIANEDAKPILIKQAVKKLTQGKLPRGKVVTGDTFTALSTSDCQNVGGKVIHVTDNRCGSSGQYCRMPDTNAVCIDKAN